MSSTSKKFYNKIVSFEAAKALTEAGYKRDYEDPGLMYFPNGHITLARVHPGYYAPTFAEAIDWFLERDVCIDLGVEHMSEPEWTWCLHLMGEKWKRAYEQNGGPLMACLDGSVKSFEECANGAILAAVKYLNM